MTVAATASPDTHPVRPSRDADKTELFLRWQQEGQRKSRPPRTHRGGPSAIARCLSERGRPFASLVIQAANPGFDGTMQIDAGSIELRNAQSLGDSVNRGRITLNGGTLKLRNATTALR